MTELKAENKRELGLYIHTPFCRSKCFYCDFSSSLIPPQAMVKKHTDAIISDLKRQKYSSGTKAPLHSIYFGGGTPSAVCVEEIEKIMDHVAANYNLLGNIHSRTQQAAVDCSTRMRQKYTQGCFSFEDTPNCVEISLEANPTDIYSGLIKQDTQKLKRYRSSGVNRISLGSQSFDDKQLKLLGRKHKSRDVINACELIKATGGLKLSIDLMYALPGQSLSEWERSLKTALLLEPDHISFYELTVPEMTVFGRMNRKGRLCLPDEDIVINMYLKGIELLGREGYVQYEISNFSKPRMECVHNLRCWSGGEYIGVGAGAWSFILGRRYRNVYPAGKYINKIFEYGDSIDFSETLSVKEALTESLILGLRLNRGISLKSFEKKWGVSPVGLLSDKIEELAEKGLLCVDGGRLFLTEQGRILSDSVFVHLM